MAPKEKLFKDPIHGYISLPVDLCRDFLDTAIFQRLRHIEQTSMRPLYPAAHHDRFIHSLGTFCLGRRALDHLIRNTDHPELVKVLESRRIRSTFLIACLMHDCGHAPCSHTFEGFYNYSDAGKANRANRLLTETFPGSDFRVEGGFDPAPHEAFSAVVLARFYKGVFPTHDCDPDLAARMITGCTYPNPKDTVQRVANCLIGLLHGSAVDMDKLDYIMRDTWASGVQNTAIDVDRLLAALCLHMDEKGEVRTCFAKSALSVLQSVVDARNYLYEWVYNHHTVLYYAELLNRALKKLARHLSAADNPDLFWEAVFSEKPFREAIPVGHGVSVHLPTDGDMMYLLKRFTADVPLPEVGEILSHAPSRVPLWKTYAEFRILFKGSALAKGETCTSVANRLPAALVEMLGDVKAEDVLVASALSKHYFIEEADIHILIDGKQMPFTELGLAKEGAKSARFFYVFVPPRHAKRKEDIVTLIRSQTR